MTSQNPLLDDSDTVRLNAAGRLIAATPDPAEP